MCAQDRAGDSRGRCASRGRRNEQLGDAAARDGKKWTKIHYWLGGSSAVIAGVSGGVALAEVSPGLAGAGCPSSPGVWGR